MPWLNISTGHHTLSHDADTDAASQASLVQINTWYAQQFAYLLQGLDAVIESDGSTLLDNCLVIWINELSKGNIHSHQPLARRDRRRRAAARCEQGGSSPTARSSRTTTSSCRSRT